MVRVLRQLSDMKKCAVCGFLKGSCHPIPNGSLNINHAEIIARITWQSMAIPPSCELMCNKSQGLSTDDLQTLAD